MIAKASSRFEERRLDVHANLGSSSTVAFLEDGDASVAYDLPSALLVSSSPLPCDICPMLDRTLRRRGSDNRGSQHLLLCRVDIQVLCAGRCRDAGAES